MTKRYFITATGTDQGKTFVTAALAWQLRQQGRSVELRKPVISGYDAQQSEYSDSAILCAALGIEASTENIHAISPLRFRAPLSPDLAAAQEDYTLTMHEILQGCPLPDTAEYQLIEGAGGILSPLTQDETNLDLAMALECPLILVSASYLGCISHILSAIAVIIGAGLPLAGLVLTQAHEQAQPLDITLTSLIPHLPRHLRHFTIPALPAMKDKWQHCPDITALLQ